MKAIKILFIICSSYLMSSCFLGFESRHNELLRSYVVDYYSVDFIELKSSTSASGYMVITIEPGPATGMGLESRWLGGHYSSGRFKENYDALCLKHNDMGYNKTIKIRNPGELPNHKYSGIDFTSIHIISDSDFDVEHPAGTDLGNIIRYAYYSPKKYIDSGYVDEFDWTIASGLAGEFYASTASPFEHPIEKLVSELTSNDMILLGIYSLGILHFERQPTLSQTHSITVTMTTDEGLEFSANIDIYF